MGICLLACFYKSNANALQTSLHGCWGLWLNCRLNVHVCKAKDVVKIAASAALNIAMFVVVITIVLVVIIIMIIVVVIIIVIVIIRNIVIIAVMLLLQSASWFLVEGWRHSGDWQGEWYHSEGCGG